MHTGCHHYDIDILSNCVVARDDTVSSVWPSLLLIKAAFETCPCPRTVAVRETVVMGYISDVDINIELITTMFEEPNENDVWLWLRLVPNVELQESFVGNRGGKCLEFGAHVAVMGISW